MEDTTSPPSTLSLKEQKELFVTGHDGTTPLEILLVCSAAPIGILLFQSIRALEEHLRKEKKPNHQATLNAASFSRQQLSSLLMEGVLLWLPVLISQTNLLYPWGVILLAFEAQSSAFIFLYFWSTRRWMKIRKWKNDAVLDTVGEDVDPDTIDQLIAQEETRIMKDSMTVYRSSLQYLTFVAILAVDFHVFPRRFAKTEVSGYGLMDLGAGSFVVAAGLVSLRARQGQHQDKQQQKISLGLKDFIRIAPLLIIGFIRLATNKGLEYQEHVSEYGVHWNFFFTLAMVTPLGSMLPGKPNWFVPLFLLAGYQTMLTKYGGQEFIEDAPRTHCNPDILVGYAGENPTLLGLCTLFAANREGVLGCIGYLFLYLSSEYIAYACLWTTTTTTTTTVNSQGRLWVIAVTLWVLLYFLVERLGIPVSRRSTNASFCVWTLAHSMLLLAAIHSAMRLYEDPRKRALAGNNKNASSESRPVVPIVFQAVNRHGLLSFLVANLLTGLTNLTINTLEVSDPVALLVLFLYLCAVGCFALVLHYALTKTTKSKEIVDVKKKKE